MKTNEQIRRAMFEGWLFSQTLADPGEVHLYQKEWAQWKACWNAAERELLPLLEKLEWSWSQRLKDDNGIKRTVKYCPCCQRRSPDNPMPWGGYRDCGHAFDCELDAIMKRIRSSPDSSGT